MENILLLTSYNSADWCEQKEDWSTAKRAKLGHNRQDIRRSITGSSQQVLTVNWQLQEPWTQINTMQQGEIKTESFLLPLFSALQVLLKTQVVFFSPIKVECSQSGSTLTGTPFPSRKFALLLLTPRRWRQKSHIVYLASLTNAGRYSCSSSSREVRLSYELSVLWSHLG